MGGVAEQEAGRIPPPHAMFMQSNGGLADAQMFQGKTFYPTSWGLLEQCRRA